MATITYKRLPSAEKSRKLRVLVVESMDHPQVRTESTKLQKYAEVDVIRVRRGSDISILLWDFLKNLHLVLRGLLDIRCPPILSTMFFGSLLLSAQAIKLHKIHGYSVFYGHWLFPAGIAALIAARATGGKVINAAWGYDIQVSRSDVKYGISKLPQRIMSKIAIEHSDILIVSHEIHKETALELTRKDHNDRIRYFPPSVDLKNFSPDQSSAVQMKKSLELPIDSSVVLFSPHLMRLYGVLDLLEAVPHVLQKKNNVYFILVGDGGLSRYISENLNKKNLAPKVRILGKVEPDKMPQIYNIADVVCDLCYAGQGTTTLEALASGVPVIGMRSRKCLIIDGYNGYLVNPYNPVELAGKITKILTQPQLKTKMQLNARTSAEAFDPEKRAEALIKTIKELTGQSSQILNRWGRVKE